jgi:hypothetical protein
MAKVESFKLVKWTIFRYNRINTQLNYILPFISTKLNLAQHFYSHIILLIITITSIYHTQDIK